MRILKWTLFIVLLLGAAAGGFAYWRHQERYPTTDDAYVHAHVVHIAAQVQGPVSQVFVHNFHEVNKGEALFDIDPAPFAIAVRRAQADLDLTRQEIASEEAAVQAAKALVAQRQAQLLDAQQNARRVLKLVQEKTVPPSQGDTVRAAEDAAQAALSAAQAELEKARRTLGSEGDHNARLRAAEAALAQAKLNLQHTHVSAPATGIVADFTLRPGTMVDKGVPQFALVEDGKWWVNANYKETDLARIHPGQPATISVDIYPNHAFHGVVERISPASGVAFSLLPPENATGNWVKVTQRFAVRVQITDPSPRFPLRIGASSSVTINTTRGAERS